MKITILGTGTFYVNRFRSGPAYLLEAGGKKILIDCGPGTLMRLSDVGVAPDDLDYILISHLHGDHSGDLFAILMGFALKPFFSTETEYKTPIIYGPKNISTFGKRLGDVYQLKTLDNYEKIKYVEISSEFIIGDITVKAFPVSHTAAGLAADAWAFRFEYDGKVLVYSGDSIKCPGIEQACVDADIFVCDASYQKGKGSPAHMNTTEIGEIAATANVKSVVLSHFYPNTENVDLIAEVKEEFPGEVERGADLMVIEV